MIHIIVKGTGDPENSEVVLHNTAGLAPGEMVFIEYAEVVEWLNKTYPILTPTFEVEFGLHG